MAVANIDKAVEVRDHLTFARDFLNMVAGHSEAKFKCGFNREVEALRDRVAQLGSSLLQGGVDGSGFLDLMGEVITLCQEDSRMSFFRRGSSGSFHDEGASAKSAPGAPDGSGIWAKETAKRLRSAAEIFVEEVADQQSRTALRARMATAIPASNEPTPPPVLTPDERAIQGQVGVLETIQTQLGRFFRERAGFFTRYEDRRGPELIHQLEDAFRALGRDFSEAHYHELQDSLAALWNYSYFFYQAMGKENQPGVVGQEQSERYQRLQVHWDDLGRGELGLAGQRELHEGLTFMQAAQVALSATYPSEIPHELGYIREQIGKLEIEHLAEACRRFAALR